MFSRSFLNKHFTAYTCTDAYNFEDLLISLVDMQRKRKRKIYTLEDGKREVASVTSSEARSKTSIHVAHLGGSNSRTSSVIRCLLAMFTGSCNRSKDRVTSICIRHFDIGDVYPKKL